MNKKFSSLPPEQYAREVLCYLKIDTIPIPLLEIYQLFDLELVFRNDLDAEGILVSVGNRHLVLIKDGIDSYETRLLYTIAHELGHYYLPSHQQRLFVCNANDMQQYRPVLKLEYEANRFASELLMPDPQFSRDVYHSDLVMEDLIHLANKYQTSLTSTAIRFAARTNLIGAIICCQDDAVSWVVKTKDTEGVEFRTGQLSEQAYAHNCFVDRVIDGNKHRVQPQTWLSSVDVECDYYVYEQTISMPRLNQTLSIVTIEYDDA